MNNKARLGFFALIGLAAIVVSILAVGNFSMGRTYNVYVSFRNASGLAKKAKVKIAGVDIGFMKSLELKNSKARMRLAINRDIVLYKNATASIVSMGIIGTKYIEIIPGDDSYPLLQDGDEIAASDSASLEGTISKIADKINTALDDFGKNGKNGNMMENLSEAIYDLKSVMKNIAAQNAQITSAIRNFGSFSANLAQITEQNKQDIRDAITVIRDAAEKLDAFAEKLNAGKGAVNTLLNDEELSKNLKETVASAKATVKSLEETVGKAGKLELSWNYMGRYNVRDEKFRSDLGIMISPNDGKFYYVGVANVADSRNTAGSERDGINKLDALMGFRKNKAEIYAGVIRGAAGVGAGYSFFEPIYAPYRTLQANLNVYDFARKNNRPQINAGVRVGITGWLYAGVMVEDAIYRTSVTPFVKVEIKDKDLASLLGIISIAAVSTK